MKAILISIALLFSTTLYAGPFAVTQDPDLYDGYSGSKVFPTAIQPGIGDNYASSILFSTGFADSGHLEQQGSENAYGSVLLDLGHAIDW